MIQRPLALLACLGLLTAADPVRITIANGDMSFGGGKPSGWETEWAGSGKILVSRDTTVFHTAPASLCVKSDGGSANGNGTCVIEVGGDTEIELTGWVKSEGKLKVNVMAQPFGADWAKGPLGFQQLKYLHDNQSYDWTEWTARFKTPSGTAHLLVGVMIEGEGKAWLDDVRNTADPVFADLEAKEKPVKIGIFELATAPEGDPVATALPGGKPWVPGWCRWDWRAAWVGQHQNFIANTKANAGKIDVVVYGDSITQGWGDGVKQLDPKLNIVNYGIGGDSTRQILYRASHGELDGISPRLIVLAIGTNNLYDDANGGTDQEIATGIEMCVKLLKAKQPKAKVLISGLLPRQNDWFCGRVRTINAIVRKLDNGTDIRFLDTFDGFFDASSTNRVKEALFINDKGEGDWLHIGPKGYEAWTILMKPLFAEMTR